MQGRKVFAVCAVGLALAVPLVAQAELSAEAVLDKVYGQRSAKGCWPTTDDGQSYCMKVDHADQRGTATGNRLYLLVTGEAVDAQGEAISAHALSGLVGAFVVEEHNGKAELIASDPKIPMGEFGSPPTDWKLSLLGPSDYWGWQNTTGGGNQGVFYSWYVLLAPYGNKISNLADFNASYDNTGSCGDKACERHTGSVDSTLVIDSSKNTEKVYPVQVTVTGTVKGKKLKPKTWTLPFDYKKWTYSKPKDWPLGQVDF